MTYGPQGAQQYSWGVKIGAGAPRNAMDIGRYRWSSLC